MSKELITKETLFVADKTGQMVLSESALERIEEMERMRKALDKEFKKYKKALLEGMEEYGLKKCETEDVLVTYVEPTERVSIDQKKLWEKYKDVAFDCQTVSDVKSSVRVTVR